MFENINIAAFNYFDYFIVAILIGSSVAAAFRGFIRSFFGFFGWIIALALTVNNFDSIKAMLAPHIESGIILNLSASAGAYMFFLVAINFMVGKILGFVLGFAGGLVDMALGAFFGFVRGMVVASVIFWMIITAFKVVNIGTDVPEIVKDAQMYQTLQKSTAMLINILSDEAMRNKLLGMIKLGGLNLNIPNLDLDPNKAVDDITNGMKNVFHDNNVFK